MSKNSARPVAGGHLLIHAFRRRKPLILGLMLASAIIGYLWSSSANRLYKASATLRASHTSDLSGWTSSVSNFSARRDVLEQTLARSEDSTREYRSLGQYVLPIGFDVAVNGNYVHLHVSDGCALRATALVNNWATTIVSLITAELSRTGDAEKKEFETAASIYFSSLYALSCAEQLDTVEWDINDSASIARNMTRSTAEAIQLISQEMLKTHFELSRIDAEAITLHTEVQAARSSVEPEVLRKLLTAQLERLTTLKRSLYQKLNSFYLRVPAMESQRAELMILYKKYLQAAAERAASLTIDAAAPGPAGESGTSRQFRPIASFMVAGLIIGMLLATCLEVFSPTIYGVRHMLRILDKNTPIVTIERHSPSRYSPRNPAPMGSLAVEVLSSIPQQICAIVVIVSAKAGEGRTLIAKELARLIALQGKRTLLIDSCSVNKVHDNEQASAEACVPNAREEIKTYDTLSMPGTRYWTRESIENIISTRRPCYDLIIFDSDPILRSATAKTLLAVSDLAVFVVRSGYTKELELRNGLELVSHQHPVALLPVLNGIRTVDLRIDGLG